MLMVLLNALQQAALFMPLALGLYMTYRIMKITDLTVEASFVLGAAVYARCITGMHGHDIVAVFMAMLACACVGIGVALMQRFAKIDPLIASILAIFMLYSVNFQAMGRPNISLLNTPSFLHGLGMTHPTLTTYIPLLVVCLLAVITYGIMKTRIGLLSRTGVFGFF